MEFNGRQIADEIASGTQAMQNKLQRYETLRMMYKGEPRKADSPIKGGVSLHWPIIQPVGDTLNAHVVNTITSKSPTCIPKCYESEGSEETLTKALQFFSEKDKLKNALKKVGPPTVTSNVGILEGRWDDEECAFEFDVIPASSFVVYPSWSQNLGECKFCGHKFHRRRSEVESLMDSGFYEKGAIQAKDIEEPTTPTTNASRNVPSHAVDKGDESIEIWRLLYKVEKKLWQIIVLPETGHILRKELWSYGKCNYFAFGYKPKEIEDGFWPTNSVANDIQELQLMANALVSDAVNGQRMGMFGVGFSKTIDTQLSYVQFQPGSFHQGMIDPQMFFPQVNISYTMPILERVLQQANEAARLSDMTRGVKNSGNKTATQAEFEAMGSQRAIDEYIENYGATVVEIFEFMQSVLAKHFAKWSKKYGDYLGLEDDAKSHIAAPALWSLNVASIGATPTVLMGLINQFMAVAQDPEYKFDKYKLGKTLLEIAELIGLSNASDFQYPEDPIKLAELLAEELEKIGVDGSLVLGATATAIQMSDADGMAGVSSQPMLPSPPQGLGGAVGAEQTALGTGEGNTGFDQSGVM